MKRVHILGRKNSGKTTLIVDLVRCLASQGYRVGTIKHTHHDHELDTPGKDSHRHREAGSAVVGILTRGMTAVFQPDADHAPRDDSRYAAIAPMFSSCDLVLVEGDLKATAPRVEVWREKVGQPPIAVNDRSIAAIISDDAVDIKMSIWKRNNIEVIGERVLRLADSVHSERKPGVWQ